ncbi:Galactose/methyl galactoside import ATP-binding protein MglA [bioreactor metagenome]|uniref:Galactose/methyl galactoside import ATP-binding protein MglA n=1 Tax=bioreactor metagenome TaxID=1076179 RepID=A0A644YJK3_9ZZZZ
MGFSRVRFNNFKNLEPREMRWSPGLNLLTGENGAGKSTLMSVLFGLYQPEKGIIKKDGKVVKISDPNDANALGIGMVHQHFKLVEVFSVLDNIILGVEPNKMGFLRKDEARQKVMALSEKYGLKADPDALIEDISVGMQQRVEILKMLYRDNDILIFDEPTAVLTPQEIDELMAIMRGFTKEGKSILFITHKLAEIMRVADRCTVLRKGRCMGTVDIKNTTKEELTRMMVGRDVSFMVEKKPIAPGEVVLDVQHVTVPSKLHKNNAVKDVSFRVRGGEIVCLAGIEGNGQGEFTEALTGLERQSGGKITLCGKDISNATVRQRSVVGMSHIPADRHKHGLILDFTLAENMVLQRYWQPRFQKCGFIRKAEVRAYSDMLIEQYDVRSGQGSDTPARSMSGGNQQKAIVAREIDKNPELLVAIQPTRGLDVGAIEYIHKQLVRQRDEGKAVLLVSLELDEVMNVSDRILVMFEGEIVGEFDPKKTTVSELGLYMAGAKRMEKEAMSQ